MIILFFMFLPSVLVASVSGVCSKPKDTGPCRDFVVKWHFDNSIGRCTRFWYGGCDGNENRFETQDECSRACPARKDITPTPSTTTPPSTTPTSQLYCRPEEFTCRKRFQCIRGLYECDGRQDCFDNTDEDHCNNVRHPCDNSPCGPYSLCTEVNGQATCSCQPLHVGNPPTCRPECVTNSECAPHLSCVNQICVSPCLNQCAPNAVCNVIHHNATCSCEVGFTGDPFTNCYRIPSTPVDPCRPSPCGPHSVCQNIEGYARCTCLPGYSGAPPNCVPDAECVSHANCRNDHSCLNGKCQDPCTITTCGPHARCRTRDHFPICPCDEGYKRDPDTKLCHPKVTEKPPTPIIDPRCTDNEELANCTVITLAKYCHHLYYAKFCCRSCTLAGQLP